MYVYLNTSEEFDCRVDNSKIYYIYIQIRFYVFTNPHRRTAILQHSIHRSLFSYEIDITPETLCV